MSCGQSEKFWLQNLGSLFSSPQMIPMKNMNFSEQLNAITRLIVVIFVVLFLIKFEYAIHFLVLSLAFIIIIFYVQKRKMSLSLSMQSSPSSSSTPSTPSTPSSQNYTQKPGNIRENYVPPVMVSYSYGGPNPKVSSQVAMSRPPVNAKNLTSTKIVDRNGERMKQTIIEMPTALPFCNDFVSVGDVDFSSGNLTPASNFAASINEQLVGPANPKTLIKPVVKPPIYDLDYWGDTKLVTFPQINRADAQLDMYLSGYAESTCCDYLNPGAEIVPKENRKYKIPVGGQIPPFASEDTNRKLYPEDRKLYVQRNRSPQENPSRENYAPKSPVVGRACGRNPIQSPFVEQDQQYVSTQQVPTIRNGVELPYIRASSPFTSFPPFVGPVGLKGPMNPADDFRESFGETEIMQDGYGKVFTPLDEEKTYVLQPSQPGWVNTACGYDPNQVIDAGLPSNLPAGNCEKDPRMKQYNTNLFTQTVTPGVYTRSQVNEPINSNIGISFQQQFEPVTCNRDEKGLLYTQHDPRMVETGIVEEVEPMEIQARYDNVYDPRFYGYGTSYRSYNEPVTGQTRFMYDDVNAIRMPNYVVRSKIDHLPYADSYGPVQEGSEFGNVHNPNIRQLVQDSWLRNSLEFRNDLTERQMRKINAEMWQKRQSPLGPKPVGT